jgi:multiple sugar transport system permease protein
MKAIKNFNYNKFFLHFVLVIIAVVTLIPIIFTLKVSFEAYEYAYKVPSIKLNGFTLSNYRKIFDQQDLMLPRWFFNSLFVSIVLVFIQVHIVSMAAYAFARLRMPGKNVIFMLLLFTMMIPTQVTMIPVYLIIKKLHLLDSYLALWLPAIANVFGVFLLKQFYSTVPKEFEEVARMDGVGRFKIYTAVMMPLVKSGTIALGILTFLASWNDLFWPLIVMNKIEMRTLTVGLTILNGTFNTDKALVLAGTFLALIPALTLYGIFQRKIIEGTMLSGMGGR